MKVGGRLFRKPPNPSKAERFQPKCVDGRCPDRRAHDGKVSRERQFCEDRGVGSAKEARSRCRRHR